MTLQPADPATNSRRKHWIIAAQAAAVILLVIVNVVLWQRGSSPASPSAEASSVAPGTSATTSTTAAAPTSAASTAAARGASGSLDQASADALAKAGRLVLVVDTASSMRDQWPALADGIRGLLAEAPKELTVSLVGSGTGGPRVVLEPVAVGDGGAEKLAAAVAGLSPTDGTARPLYDALMLAYQRSLVGAPADRTPLVLAVTDASPKGGAGRETYAAFVAVETNKRLVAAHPVLLGVTDRADMPELRRAADVSRGTARAVPTAADLPQALRTFASSGRH